jgi:hypothetical protein
LIECVASPDGSVQQRFDGFVRSVRMFANQAAEEFGSDRRRVRPISGASKFLWYRLFLRSGSPQNVYLLPQHPNFHLKHDASLDPGLWPNAIESICGYVGAASASLHSQDSVSRATDALFWWGRESSAPHYFDLYLQKYGKINPIFPGVVFFDVELPVAVPDVISCEEFVQTRFFREWLAPQSLMDGLFSNLEKGATSCALFTAMRHAEQGQVDDRMRRRFELITPHVRRAMLIGKVIDLHRVEAAALADSLDELASGMFIVDQSGRIIHANASAHRLIAEANVLRATNGRVAALDLEGNRNLLDIFMAAQAGDAAVGKRGIALPLKALSGERYVAHVLPLTSGARRKGWRFLLGYGGDVRPQGGAGFAITARGGRRRVQPDAGGGPGHVCHRRDRRSA